MLRKAIKLLRKTIDETKDLVVVLRQSGLSIRANYREEEVERLQHILNLLELENDKETKRLQRISDICLSWQNES